MKKDEGLRYARLLKKKLLSAGLPVQQVYLFGSVASGEATEASDIDVAVISLPFKKSRREENVDFFRMSNDIDLRIETVCLHPEDMENRYSTLVHEVKTHGIPVD